MEETDERLSGSLQQTPSLTDPNRTTGLHPSPHEGISTAALSDRYILGPEINRGGMGIIYRATDTTLDREVAIKVLQDRFPAESGMARRFEAEARIAAQLQHPGLPPVHDFGTLPDRRPFLAMKLIKGETLERLLAARPNVDSDRGRFIAVFEQICQTLAYAHAHRVIHRDLKPSNIMVGAFGEVQVMDWGLAKILSSQDSDNTDPDETRAETEVKGNPDSDGSFTRAGSLLGTPAFIPPEQATGALSKINERSDVFGLGAILAVILTGKPPFTGQSSDTIRLKASQGDIEECLERLDRCSGDPELVELCKRCLNPKAERRPANANEVAQAVGQIRLQSEERARQAELDKIQLAAEQKETQARSAERRRRRRLALMATGSVALVVIISLALGLVAVSREQLATLAQKEIADENFKLAFEASNGGFDAVERAEAFLASKPDTMDARKKALEAGSVAFRKFLEQKPDDQELQLRAASLFRMTANVYRMEGKIVPSQTHYEESLTLLGKQPDGQAKQLRQSQVLRDFAQLRTIQGQLKEGLELADRAKVILEASWKERPTDVRRQRNLATIELDRAGILEGMGQLDQAETALTRAIEFYKALVDLPKNQVAAYDPLLYSAALSRMAKLKRKAGQIPEAVKLHISSIALLQLYFGRIKLEEEDLKKVNTAKVVEFNATLFDGLNLTDVYHFVTRARLDQAQTLMLDPQSKKVEGLLGAVVDQWKNLAASHSQSQHYGSFLAHARVIRGDWLAKQGRADDAKADLEAAQKLLLNLIKESPEIAYFHLDLGRARWGLAKLSGKADDLRQAEEHLKKAVELAPDLAEAKKTLDEFQK